MKIPNKPVAEWTLLEAKAYCQKNNNGGSNDCRKDFDCVLYCANVCACYPCEYEPLDRPTFTPDEKAYLRVLREAGICWITRNYLGELQGWMHEPSVTIEDYGESTDVTYYDVFRNPWDLPDGTLPTLRKNAIMCVGDIIDEA